MIVQEMLELAHERGDRPFLHFEDQSWTYAEYADICEAAAASWTRAGIGKGDAVAMLLPNSPQYLAALFGLACVGGVAATLNTGYKPDEAKYAIEKASAKLILTDQELGASTIDPILAQLPGVMKVLYIEAPEDGFDGSATTAGANSFPGVSEDDVAAVLYTSGTSGNPKGALAPQRQLAINGRGLADAIDIQEGEVHYSLFPLFHNNAQAIVSAALQVGAEVVLGTRFSLSAFWPTVRQYGITHCSYLGPVIPLLDKLADPLEVDNPLRVLWGAGTPAAVQERLAERWGVTFVEVYGMTEIGIVLANSVTGRRRAGSIGTAVGKHHITIVDDGGVEVPRGTTGEFVVDYRPGMFHGYIGDQAATDVVIRDGVVHTGDAGQQDDGGFFYFVDRYKDIIRRGGENIASADVEVAVRAHAQVLDVAAIPAPDELREEEVRIIVVLKDDEEVIDLRELAPNLVSWCSDRLAAFKVPRYVEFAPDLPRTATGKIRKQQLKAGFRMTAFYDAAESSWNEGLDEAAQAAGTEPR